MSDYNTTRDAAGKVTGHYGQVLQNLEDELMSDDLVKRLRDRDHVGTATTERNFLKSVADRIEQLAATNEELEALLAKAVEALEWVKFGGGPRGEGYHEFACNTLAELKGEK